MSAPTLSVSEAISLAQEGQREIARQIAHHIARAVGHAFGRRGNTSSK